MTGDVICYVDTRYQHPSIVSVKTSFPKLNGQLVPKKENWWERMCGIWFLGSQVTMFSYTWINAEPLTIRKNVLLKCQWPDRCNESWKWSANDFWHELGFHSSIQDYWYPFRMCACKRSDSLHKFTIHRIHSTKKSLKSMIPLPNSIVLFFFIQNAWRKSNYQTNNRVNKISLMCTWISSFPSFNSIHTLMITTLSKYVDSCNLERKCLVLEPHVV